MTDEKRLKAIFTKYVKEIVVAVVSVVTVVMQLAILIIKKNKSRKKFLRGY